MDRGRAGALVVLAALAVALLAGCGSDEPTEGSAGTSPPRGGIEVTQVAKFSNTLTGFAASADGSEMLVGDRLGAIWRLRGGRAQDGTIPKLDPKPALDLTKEVSTAPGERGFFNLAISPDQRWLVVDFTSRDGTITVIQYRYTPGQDIDPDSGRTLLALPDPYAWHHGGGLAFDKAGDLYVGIGDMEFRQVDPPGPQDPTMMLGGVARIPASVVDDPSKTSRPTPEDMVARGMRNPWRISIDDRTGDLWIGDVGLDTYEEINRIPAADLDGSTVTNFGWPYREGTAKQQGTAPAGSTFVDPVRAIHHRTGVCGIVGGYHYRGDLLPDLRGRYVYGDLCGQHLQTITTSADARKVTSDDEIADLSETITSLGQDGDGELYLLGSTGGLYRLEPKGSKAATSAQEPPKQETTTTIERSRDDCDGGVVAAMLPLSDIGSMDGPELVAAVAKTTKRLDELVPTLPPYIKEDAEIVQRVMHELSQRLAATDGTKAEALVPLKEDMMAGRREFSGFPAAMARVVDSECG